MSVDFRQLHGLHHFALQHFAYADDVRTHGCADYWMSPDEIREQLASHGLLLGDCDDFAALCVMLARQQGLPARFVFCQAETGEYHLVCEVEGWILDNRQMDVIARDDLDYTWLAISGYAAGDPWRIVAA